MATPDRPYPWVWVCQARKLQQEVFKPYTWVSDLGGSAELQLLGPLQDDLALVLVQNMVEPGRPVCVCVFVCAISTIPGRPSAHTITLIRNA